MTEPKADRPIRILYIDTEGVWRGGQEQLFGLMQGMSQRGHDVSLACPADSPLSKRALAIGLKHYPFAQRSELSPLALWRFERIVKKGRFNIVHFNTQKTILIGGMATRSLQETVTVTSRRVNFPLVSRLSCLKYNGMVDRIFTVSSSIKETLIHNGVRPDLIEVIYEGVDLEWIDRQHAPPLLLPARGPVVGIVAHLSPEKGHTTLLEAANLLKERWPEATYLIIGDGALREHLEAMAERSGLSDRVIFTGFREDSEALMKQFDLFCLPSLSEGLSSAILAAMASRLPVVATSVGGIPELVVEGKTGFLVPPQSPEPLGAALAKLLSSARLRAEMGEAGRRRIENHFTVERKLQASENAYVKLLEVKGIR